MPKFVLEGRELTGTEICHAIHTLISLFEVAVLVMEHYNLGPPEANRVLGNRARVGHVGALIVYVLAVTLSYWLALTE